MSKGLDPQDVANALTGDMKFIAMDADGTWRPSTKAPVGTINGDEFIFSNDTLVFSGVLPIKIIYDGYWEDSIFEKQQQFEDGELVTYLLDGVWDAGRYKKPDFVYNSNKPTGSGWFYRVDKIIKFDQELLGTVAG